MDSLGAAFCTSAPKVSNVRNNATARCSANVLLMRTSRRAVIAVGLNLLLSPHRQGILHADAEVEFATLTSGLVVQDLRTGKGVSPKDGNEVVVRWTGRLAGRYGWPFQREDGSEARYILGRDKLIAGFDEGVRGMREGGKRRLIIPPSLGYSSGRENPRPVAFGDRRRLESTVANPRRIAGAGQVVIDVELLKVRPPRIR